MQEGMRRLYGAISEAFLALNDPETRARYLEAETGATADSVTSGLRPIERPAGEAAMDLSETTPSAGVPSDGPPPSAPEPEAPPVEEAQLAVPEDLPADELHAHALDALARDLPKEALELCRRACEADPDHPDYAATSLWIQAKLPRPDLKVLTLDLDDLLRIHLDHVPARYYRGVLRRRLGYDSAAKQDFERVLELDPDHAGAHAQLAELAKGGGRRR